MLLDIYLNALQCETEVDIMSLHETFKALSDPVRRDILGLLKNNKMSAGEIAAKFKLTNATVSYHLKLLKRADLIYETKVKNFVFYELSTTVFDDVLLWMKQFSKGD